MLSFLTNLMFCRLIVRKGLRHYLVKREEGLPFNEQYK